MILHINIINQKHLYSQKSYNNPQYYVYFLQIKKIDLNIANESNMLKTFIL